MQQTIDGSAPNKSAPPPPSAQSGIGWLMSIGITVATIFVLWFGFIFLRDSDAPKIIIALVAIIWGVGGMVLLFISANSLVDQLPASVKQHVLPYVFVGPAILLLGWYLALPTLRTFYMSLFDESTTNFVGLKNYVSVFTERFMLEAFRNNLLWIVFGASLSAIFGLLVAVLADRSNFERLAKSLIFLPMAISMVGAGVIWNFIYEVKDVSDPQIGLLNAIVVAFGGDPKAWIALVQPWNNLFLIVIVIWLQTGFAMTLFSAAIKGIPAELLEAARVDGATEWQVFFRIMLPSISGTVITVTTTIVIFTLKIFDVVQVMTGGQFGTHVIATQFYRLSFTSRDLGLASAVAMVLLIAVIPVMVYNLRSFREREAF